MARKRPDPLLQLISFVARGRDPVLVHEPAARTSKAKRSAKREVASTAEIDGSCLIWGENGFPRTNPATGLPMFGICFDIGGNAYGTRNNE